MNESKTVSSTKIQEREINESRMKKAQQDMIDSFIKSHPEMSNEELQAVAKFGDERGIAQIEDAYMLMTIQQEKHKAKTEGVKQVTEKRAKPSINFRNLNEIRRIHDPS